MTMDTQNENIKKLIKQLLIEVGEDVKRDGLIETPHRVAKYYSEVLKGYSMNIEDLIKTFPSESTDELVIIKNISFFSLCEHHMVPFFGTVDIGYLPSDKIMGLSKFSRIVTMFALRLQTQERLNQQVLEAVVKYLNPKGCVVRIRASHLCIAMRGVKDINSETVTIKSDGLLKENLEQMKIFLSQID